MPVPGVDTLAITVKLDSVTNDGTFPYDVSTYLRLVDGINIGRGRGDEFTDVQPSTCSLTLENIDGRFTLGSTVGGYGAINIDRGIQVSYTINGVTTKRFTGYVQTWPVEWPDGSDTFAVARVTAVDRLARLSRRVLRSVIEQEIRADAPMFYYTLGEAAGATSAGDTSGNNAPTIVNTGTGTAVVFGASGGPTTDSLTSAKFTAQGRHLAFTSRSTLASITTSVTLAVCVTTTHDTFSDWSVALEDAPNSSGIPGLPSALRLGTDGNQQAFAQLRTPLVNIFVDGLGPGTSDGKPHEIAATFSGTTLTLYVDGVSVGTASDASAALPAFRTLNVGMNGTAGQTLTASHVAAWPSVVGSTRLAAHANAVLNGFATERSDQRVARYAGYANIAAGDQVLEAGVLASVPHQQIEGMNPLAAMAKVMQAEGGLLFLRGDGKLVMQNRTHRAAQVAPDLTLTTNDISPDSRLAADMQLVRNYVTASAGSNGAVQVAQNAASVTNHEQYPDDLSGLLVTTDVEALDVANWRAGVYAEPAARMPSLALDLMTLTAAQAASAQALELSDRVQITGLPSQALNGTTTADLVVEGWTETLSENSWDMQFNTSNFSQASAWVLDNSTYSVLGTATRLSY